LFRHTLAPQITSLHILAIVFLSNSMQTTTVVAEDKINELQTIITNISSETHEE